MNSDLFGLSAGNGKMRGHNLCACGRKKYLLGTCCWKCEWKEDQARFDELDRLIAEGKQYEKNYCRDRLAEQSMAYQHAAGEYEVSEMIPEAEG